MEHGYSQNTKIISLPSYLLINVAVWFVCNREIALSKQ